MSKRAREERKDCEVEVISNGLCNPRERVTFGVYVDNTVREAFDAGWVLAKCMKDLIKRMERVRRISMDDCATPKVLAISSGPTNISHLLCGYHRYWKYEIVVQPLVVRKLKDMCMDVCLDYLMVQDPDKTAPRYRYAEYEDVIPEGIESLLSKAWVDARERGMTFDVKKNGKVDVTEARFSYHSPIEIGSYKRTPHPTEDFIISKDASVGTCESSSSSRPSLASRTLSLSISSSLSSPLTAVIPGPRCSQRCSIVGSRGNSSATPAP